MVSRLLDDVAYAEQYEARCRRWVSEMQGRVRDPQLYASACLVFARALEDGDIPRGLFKNALDYVERNRIAGKLRQPPGKVFMSCLHNLYDQLKLAWPFGKETR